MTSHDELCPLHTPHITGFCQCYLIAKVRADERKRILTEDQALGSMVRKDERMLVLASLRTKIEALPDEHHYGKNRGGCIDRAAVLDLIDGSTDGPR